MPSCKKDTEEEIRIEAPQMDNGPITVKKTKLRKLKIARQHLPQSYEYDPYVSCLAGLYSCRWERYEQKRIKPGQCCCGIGECAFFALLLFAFFLWFIFTYMWGQLKNDYNAFDRYNFANYGFWFHWSILLLVLAALILSYLLFLLILAVCMMTESQQLYLHWIHKMVTVFVLGLAATAYVVLSAMWPEQWSTLGLSFQVTAPYLHMGAIIAMILVAWPLALHFFQMKNKVLQVLILGSYLAVLLFFYFIPLGLKSPCIREKGTLGPKPALIGHRGAPMVAPENTKMSFRKASEYGAYGFEADVTISYDGVPFLMHDKTLRRTTDIDSVSPEAVNRDAATFPWSFLKNLNAGNWFFEKRPFFEMPYLSLQDQIEAKNQSIYKFSDFLDFADQENKYVIFDLYRPPRFHPYRHNWIKRALEVILNESRIRPDLVLWLPELGRSYIQSVAPGFQQTTSDPGPIEELRKRNIVRLNLNYRTMGNVNIREYAEANITTNLWVVSEPWLFSLAWCYGAHSVTTNDIHNLRNMHQPSFFMTPQEYRSLWIITDVLSFLFISLFFLIHWWRELGPPCCEVESSESLESGTYNRFETELNKMSIVT
uniref:Glycerophosphodiester phosphodiesterase domain-containing protein 5-like isoform X2 n=1 Tax=Pogona vitticeps TaxID=103695 RepID=A0ABM5FVY8_9SAUR